MDRETTDTTIGNEQRLRMLAETAPDAIVLLEDSGKILFWNRAAADLFGYHSDEALGMPYASLVRDRYRRSGLDNRRGPADKDQSEYLRRSEKWAKRKDGVEIPIETSMAAWELQGARLFTAIVRDATEQRQAEEKARRYTDQLEEANHMKDLFTDILHHDLMNPAGVVLSLAEMLLERESDRRRRGILIGIRDSSQKLLEMIESAAFYAKLSNRDMIERQTIDLDEVLRKSVADISHSLEKKGMRLEICSRDRCTIQGNPILENVFSNLVSNAMKYASSGNRVQIGILDGGEKWKVYVKDWGAGIPPDDHQRVFRRYERLGKEGVEGSGLGLAICKRIVELHGGEIWVEGNPEGGSIFFVSLVKGTPVTHS